MTTPTNRDLVTSLQGKTCPSCAGKKRQGETFCGGCYHALPFELRKRLYDRLGSGYAEAVTAAMTQLGCSIFAMPAAEEPTRTAKPATRDIGAQMTLFKQGAREGIRR